MNSFQDKNSEIIYRRDKKAILTKIDKNYKIRSIFNYLKKLKISQMMIQICSDYIITYFKKSSWHRQDLLSASMINLV